MTKTRFHQAFGKAREFGLDKAMRMGYIRMSEYVVIFNILRSR